MSKHTPGPWALNGPWHIQAETPMNDPTGKRVVALITPCRGASQAEREANAHLVAAAPDLMAALHTAADALSPPRNQEEIKALAVVRAAIAKATTP